MCAPCDCVDWCVCVCVHLRMCVFIPGLRPCIPLRLASAVCVCMCVLSILTSVTVCVMKYGFARSIQITVKRILDFLQQNSPSHDTKILYPSATRIEGESFQVILSLLLQRFVWRPTADKLTLAPLSAVHLYVETLTTHRLPPSAHSPGARTLSAAATCSADGTLRSHTRPSVSSARSAA